MKKEKCLICGFDKFVEKHHIIKRRYFGSDNEENIVCLCPNHHWIADFGNDNDKNYILEKIKELSGKTGKEIFSDEKENLKIKARRLVEEVLGRYTDEEWKEKNMEDEFNFNFTMNTLRGNESTKIISNKLNRRAELLLIRDLIDKEIQETII
jgi:hypothetical protein